MAGELYGDFSRIASIKPSVSSLLAQQGRVLLDSDLNAETALLTGQMRAMLVDLVGPAAGPSANLGFEIKATKEDGRLVVTALPGHDGMVGRYYVGGIACEIDRETTYFDQGAFLDPEREDDQLPDLPFVVYLKVWERSISALEDPSSREVALGTNGPDTSTRTQVVWQLRATADVFENITADELKATPASKAADAANVAWLKWEAARQVGRGTLKARAKRPDDADDEPCPVPPASAYRGLENQLYRVEVHRVMRDAAGMPTGLEFKWSRDNASATYPIETFGEDGKVVTLTTIGRDRRLMIDVGDWVEVVDDRYSLYPGVGPFRRTSNPLLRIMEVEPPDRTVTLSDTSEEVGHVAAWHPFLRRWDHQPRPGGAKLGEGGGLIVDFATTDQPWIDLEDGIQVQFQQGKLRVGDYWLIPARTEIGDVDWPGDPTDPEAVPPVGIDYAFAPLAIVRGENDVVSLRQKFGPIAVSA